MLRNRTSQTTLDCGHTVEPVSTGTTPIDCRSCDSRLMPDSVVAGRRTPSFDSSSVPPGLLKDHQTGAWAELIVTAGSVRFHDADPPWSAVATTSKSLVIVPGRFHHVEPEPGAEFYVQFYDFPPD